MHTAKDQNTKNQINKNLEEKEKKWALTKNDNEHLTF